ncbi:MAG TPA: glycosyltransferase family 4 protein [bacterium]|nr:glycosyltransferase family 4 protein [bacterium]
MKTRVCHIITRLIQGGAQENTVATAALLNRSSGYEADLITGPAIGPEGTLIPQAQAVISRVIVIDELRRSIHPLYDIVSFWKLRRLLLKERYDIVHTHSSKAGIIGRLAAKFAGASVIIHTIHGLAFHEYQSEAVNAVYRALERVAARWTDVIITVADVMTKKALDARIGVPGKYRTIYSGMDLDAFLTPPGDIAAFRRKLGFGDGDIVIGKVGRLFHLKGHEYVIEAARHIIPKNPRVKFLFVGDGILRGELAGAVERLGLGPHFVFTGLVPAEDVPRYIHAMDIVVHASLREGLPRVVPQGSACGKPVVAFDVDGACEVIRNGETGFLVPPQDTGRLADALAALAADPEKRRKMGEAGRRTVDPIFRNEYMVEQIVKVYDKALADKSAAPNRKTQV